MMRACASAPETIYQCIYIQGRGGLRAELSAALRTGRAVRQPNRRAGMRKPRVPKELLISERPAEADDRAVPGHWEGDLVIGTPGTGAIGTLAERTSRFVMLLHLPNGHTGEQVLAAIQETLPTLPAHLRRSLTWDQGAEMVGIHDRVKIATGAAVYFCDPHSPWQRGTNENTNGLLRQYFPKGMDLTTVTREDLEYAAGGLNGRLRKTLGWKTPAQALQQILEESASIERVATTAGICRGRSLTSCTVWADALSLPALFGRTLSHLQTGSAGAFPFFPPKVSERSRFFREK
jgi:IS30 family transposase